MELHRTEPMWSATGQLIRVVTIGVAPHEGDTRELVLGLKYNYQKHNALLLARIVVPFLPITNSSDTLLTWAPTTTAHRLERGMDHAELIARHVGALMGIRCRKLLRRVNNESQTGSNRSERLARPEFAARPLHRSGNIVVIDDVVTTGATFRAAAHALVLAGAQSVTCIAPSRTV